jgi:putative MATE family efflux protein
MRLRDLFKDRQFYKTLFAIAIPIMLQNLVNTFVNMVDTVMIGRLGTTEIAAVGLGNQVFFLYNMILFGICSGGAIFTAQFWGKQDIQGIRKTMGLCLISSLSVAVIFTGMALINSEGIIGVYSRDPEVIRLGGQYLKTLAPCFIPFGISFVFILTLRSVERVRLAMVTTIIALTINMTLNYFFIFGIGPVPAMGVTGAARATVIARYTELIILISVSYARRYPMAGKLRELMAFNSPFVSRFVRITFPVVLNETLWALGISVQNIIFARNHTDAIAAFNITNTVSQLTWVIFIGLGNGIAVLIGKKIGEGEEQTARDYARRITAFAPLMAAAAALVLFPISRLLPFIFNVNANVLSIASVMFIILCCVYPFRAFNMTVIVGICRAGGDTIFCVLCEIIFMWGFSLPLGAAMSFIVRAPVWLIFLCIASEDLFKAALGFWRLRSGKWLHDVTG